MRTILQRTITAVAHPIFGAEVATITSKHCDQIASPNSGFVQHHLAHLSRIHAGVLLSTIRT